MWLKDHDIKAFFSVTQDKRFSVGAKNCMNLVGIGKINWYSCTWGTPRILHLGVG